MALTLDATPGSASANSYLTHEEAQAYFESRSPVAAWDASDSQAALLVMATRVIDMYFAGQRVRVDDKPPYYRVGPAWTGAPTDAVQRLAWPRTGMLNRNGFAIPSTGIPQELKDAVAELAGALATRDLTADNKNALQGITSAKAGSVSVSFADGSKIAITKMIPDSVMFMLVPSWYTEEYIESAMSGFEFEVIGS